ncbi:helix-turn-helix domain-containing protein [Chryseobacterium sp. Leaf394]|uniref:helix-turn-helix domain-containing protein n=1 Tax=Chryseobacterium sp. Leaf394 TaxID=1736361 RepID=UPI0006F88A96|nr:helix-turn-helix domain-containing protein [Chryseobacterium sp. Leaf394]KQS91626.1 transposase [Chryseobacterium sp. Leaf394]
MESNQFKHIHIGSFIRQCVVERQIDIPRICNFLDCKEEEILKMYEEENISSDVLLKWSKLLEYDFFRLYSAHLLLFTPNPMTRKTTSQNSSKLPQFRKNMYSPEIIDFMLEKISKKEMTIPEIVERYNIGKTTLYKWTKRYQLPKEDK